MTWILSAPQESAGETPTGAVDWRTETAANLSGGNTAHTAWQLPITIPGLSGDSAKLIAEWQRRTDPAWFGRAFAVSMSVNWVGTPIGAAFAGPLIGWSLNTALWAAVVFALLAAVFPLLAVPARDDSLEREINWLG